MNKLLSVTFFFFLAVFNLVANTSKLDILISDANGSSVTDLSTSDRFISLASRAFWCHETGNSTGTYQFSLTISGPTGATIQTLNSTVSSLPAITGCQVVNHDFGNLATTFISRTGSYRFNATFKEFYPETTGSINAFQTQFVTVKDGGYDKSLFSSNVRLISPGDESFIQNRRPFFQWIPSIDARKYTFVISENPDPENAPVYVKRDLTTNVFTYPNDGRPLEMGKKYYWLVKGLDVLNRPVGSNSGRSQVFSFILGDKAANQIQLISPIENKEVVDDTFTFFFRGLAGDHQYEIILADDADFHKVTWHGSTSEEKLSYSLDAPALVKQKRYYWRVQSSVPGFGLFSRSETGSFVFTGFSNKDTGVTPLSENDTGIEGRIVNQQGRAVGSAHVICEGPRGDANSGITSMATTSQGLFSLPLEKGDYTLKVFKEGHQLVKEEIEIQGLLKKDYILVSSFRAVTGRVLNGESSQGVANAQVILRSQFSEVVVRSGEDGSFSLENIKPGDYTLAAGLEPFFEKSEQSISLQENTRQNIFLQPKKTGLLKGQVLKKEDRNPVASGSLYIETLEVKNPELVDTVPSRLTIAGDGSFEAGDVPAGRYRIKAKFLSYAPVEKLVLVQGGLATTVNFEVITSPFTVSGNVRDQSDRPLYRAEIAAGSGSLVGCFSDAAGDFSCQFTGGKQSIVVSYPGKESFSQKVTIDEDVSLGAIMLNDELAELSVSAVDNRGLPVPGARLIVTTASGQVFDYSANRLGVFENIKLPRYQRYTISCEATGYESQQLSYYFDTKNESVKFTMAETLSVRGTIQTQDRRALGDAQVTLVGASNFVVSGPDGGFIIKAAAPSPLPPTFTLRVKRPGFFTELREVSTALLNQPVIIRLRDEREKATSFTSVRINNSIREIGSSLDDLEAFIKRSVARVLADLAETQNTLDTYKKILATKKKTLQQYLTELEVEKKKPYVTARALSLSVKAQALSDEIELQAAAMSKTIEQQLAAIARFIDLFTRASEQRMVTLSIRIEDLQDSIRQSPFISDSYRRVLAGSALKIKTRFDTDIQTFYRVKKKEIDDNYAAISNDINSEVEKIENEQVTASETVTAYNQHLEQLIAEEREQQLPAEAGEDEVVIDLKDKEQLSLALKIAEIIGKAKKVRNKIKAGANVLKEVPLGLKSFYDQANRVNLNLARLRKAILTMESSAKDYEVQFKTVQAFVKDVEQLLTLTEVGGFQTNFQIENKPNAPDTIVVYGSLIIKNKDLGRWNLPIPAFEVDLNDVLGEEYLQLRQRGVNSRTVLAEDLKALFTFTGIQRVRALFPAVFLQEEINFLPATVAGVADYKLPPALENFSAEEVFTSNITEFKIAELTHGEKREIMTADSYDYVHERLTPFLRSIVPADEKIFEATPDEFLADRYLPPDVMALYRQRDDDEELKKRLVQYLPQQLRENENSSILFAEISSDRIATDYLKTFLEDDLARALPEDFVTSKWQNIAPGLIKTFNAERLRQQANERLVSTVFDPEVDLKGDAILSSGEAKMPFDIGLKQLKLGYDKGRKLAYVRAEARADIGDLLKGISMPQVAIDLGNVRFWGDDSTDIESFEFSGRLNADLLGFKTSITRLSYNFKQKMISVDGEMEFKLLDKERNVKIGRAEWQPNAPLGMWILTNFEVVLSPPIKLAGLELSSMKYAAEEELLEFGGRLKANIPSTFLNEVSLTSITFQEGAFAGAIGEKFKTPLLPGTLVEVQKIVVRRQKVDGGQALDLSLTDSSLTIDHKPFFADPQDSTKPYKVTAGEIKVSWHPTKKPEIEFENLAMRFRPFEVMGGIKFGITKLVVSNRYKGQKKLNMMITMLVEFPMGGADNSSNTATWEFVSGKKPIMRDLRIAVQVGPVKFFGKVQNKERYIYAKVETTIFTTTIEGEYYHATSGNWYVSVKASGAKLPILALGVANVVLDGAGIKIGERNRNLVLGISADLQITSGASEGSFVWFAGPASVSYVGGENILKIDARGLIVPQLSFIAGGKAYMRMNITMAGRDSNLHALFMTRLRVLSLINLNAQSELFLSREYTTFAVAAGTGQGKFLGVTIFTMASFQLGLGFERDAPVSALSTYYGTQIKMPDQLRAGSITTLNTYVRISLSDLIGTKSLDNILKANLSAGFGTLIVIDYGRPLIGGGMYGYVRGQAYLFVIGLSVYVGFDIGAQIGKTKTYFSGLAAFEGCVKVVMIEKCVTLKGKIRFGDVPDGLPDEPVGFKNDPEPKGKMTVFVQDVFGVPLKGAQVSACPQPTNSIGECVTNAVVIGKETQITVSDAEGLYEVKDLVTGDGEDTGSAGPGPYAVKLEYPGQRVGFVMGPTALMANALVEVRLPNEEEIPERLNISMVNTTTQAIDDKEGKPYKKETQLAFFEDLYADDTFKIVVVGSEEFNQKYDSPGTEKALKDYAQEMTYNGKKGRVVEVTMQYGKADLAGFVVNDNNEKISGARVSLLGGSKAEGDISTETNFLGYFVFPGVQYGSTYSLKVEKENYEPVTKGVDNIGLSQSITIGKTESRVTIKAIDPAGKPLPGQNFQVTGQRRALVTNQSGTVSFLAQVDEDYIVQAATAEYPVAHIVLPEGHDDISANQEAVSFSLPKPKELNFTFIMRTGVHVSGELASTSGPLQLEKGHLKVLVDGKELTGYQLVSRPSGRFDIFLSAGGSATLELEINRPGYNQAVVNKKEGKAITLADTSRSVNRGQTDLGKITLAQSNDVRKRLAATALRAGEFILNVKDFSDVVAVKNGSVQHLSSGGLYRLKATINLQGKGHYMAQGSVVLEDILVEADVVNTELVYQVVTKEVTNKLSSNLSIQFAGIAGSAEASAVSFAEGTVTAFHRFQISSELPLANCSGLQLFTSEPLLLIKPGGEINFNFDQASSISMQVDSTASCQVGTDRYQLNRDALYITRPGGFFSDDYLLETRGVLYQGGTGSNFGGKVIPLTYTVNEGKISVRSSIARLAKDNHIQDKNNMQVTVSEISFTSQGIVKKGCISIRQPGEAATKQQCSEVAAERKLNVVINSQGESKPDEQGNRDVLKTGQGCNPAKGSFKVENYKNTGKNLFTGYCEGGE